MIKRLASRQARSSLLLVSLLIVPCRLLAEEADITSLGSKDYTEMPLEELMQINISSASKYAQKLSDAPASVTVIGSEEIERYGWLTLADVLNSVRGFHITSDRVYGYAGARGFSPTGDLNFRVLVMIDGHRTNDAIYDQAKLSGDLPLDLGLVDRIEIIRGPGASMYGGNALFGVINLITKQAKQIDGAQLAMGGGSYDTWRGRATYGKEFANGLQALVSFTGLGSDGPQLNFPDTPDRTLGVTEHTDYEHRQQVFVKTAYRGLTLKTAASKRKKGDPVGSFGSIFNSSDNYEYDEQAFIDLQYDGKLNSNLNFTGRLYNDWYRYKGNYVFDFSPDYAEPLPRTEIAKAWWWGGEARLNYTGIKDHRLGMGVEYQRNEMQRLDSDNDPPEEASHFNDTTYRAGIYFDDAYTVFDQLTLQLGFRFDKTSLNDGRFSPRTALIYRPTEATALKLLYGTAFRDPNGYERLNAARNDIALPDTESVETLEAIWEQNLGKNLFVTASVFRYVLDKQIDIEAGNLDPQRALGFEGEIDYRWDNDARLRLSYSRQMAEDAQGGQLTNSPVQLVKANLTAPLWNTPLWTGVEFQYTGARLALLEQNGATETTTVPGAGILNMTLGYTGACAMPSLSFSAYNLLDKRYFDPYVFDPGRDRIERNGRSYWLQLTADF
jgi:iron complex outermembrane receptor protein